jgi:hypothetical protein
VPPAGGPGAGPGTAAALPTPAALPQGSVPIGVQPDEATEQSSGLLTDSDADVSPNVDKT